MGKIIKVPTGMEHRFRRVGKKYFGQSKGPAGPLKTWPFLLKRNGKAVDEASLDGVTINKFGSGAWISGRNGEFRFEDLPDADYAIEVLSPAGKLVPKKYQPPNESGRRSPLPHVFDRLAYSEDPDDLMSEGDEIYVIAAEVRSIGDTLLINQDVRILDPDTEEQVGDIITTGDDGVVRAIVPENKTYRIEIQDQEFEPHAPPLAADDRPGLLLCRFLNKDGTPLANVDVEICSEDHRFEHPTDEEGKIEIPVHLGHYELNVQNQAFDAHALLMEDRDQEDNCYLFTINSAKAQTGGGA